ncbi:GntP family permease [Halogeometricum sp. S1BR25-6]|uniref:GntP family permease n=1 Tax=Halogeometricum salsisoli TaxID=2950536 RepID=A0ABU2GHR0_9EURY|nr:gluconate:H+ symporter [Halogeometricum sp. S1BR25-6]MDS0300342.1 GntP family permease [Halogeometricum sp. S1BR25-6]
MVLANPLIPLAIGVLLVVFLLVYLNLPPFVGLIIAALGVAVISSGVPINEVPAQVAQAFGETLIGVGIPILMAAIIGKTLMESGAAARIVRAALSVTGQERSEYAILTSSYLLSVPVFFDNVFYLLAPLGRAMKKRTGVKFSLYMTALCAGALATHTLVPPTPGPLAVANSLNVNLGLAILVGGAVALPTSLLGGIVYGKALHNREEFPLRESMGVSSEEIDEEMADSGTGPGLVESLTPIVLPLILIGSNTIAAALYAEGTTIRTATAFVGDATLALTAAAMFSTYTYYRLEVRDLDVLNEELTGAIKSGGNIIAITAAGGAFGAMLNTTGVGEYVAGIVTGLGFSLLVAGWLIAALMRVAQGSATVALLTGAEIMAPLTGDLSVGAVYLMLAIGAGGMIAPWFNDSGFWIVSEVGGLTQTETFKTYSASATIMSIAGLLLILLLSSVVPLA